MIWFEPPNQIISWDYTIPNALTDSDIKMIENYAGAYPDQFEKAEVRTENSPVDLDYRRTDVMFLHDMEVFSELYNKVFDTVLSVNTTHFRYSLNYAEVLQYSVYKGSDLGYYDIHCDTQLRNTSGFNRKISFSILLNDPSEFEGGDLLFHASREPYCAEMKKGDMVLFPSFLPHSVSPVTKGVRKTLVGWICGPNLV
jgi:PKHD-type hydroxylase